MSKAKLPTRFSSAPVVYVDATMGRMMVTSEEMYETLVHEHGEWRIGSFSSDALRKEFKRLDNTAESWAVFQQAMKGVGFL